MSTVDLRGRFWTSPTVTFLAVSMQSYTRLIHDLFSNNEQGFAYDPNDLSTMYQDAAGTIPVTAAGQPVGLVLDKSKGLVLGSQLINNGTFDTDTVWNKGNGWSISGGKARFDGSTSFSNLGNTISAPISGKFLKVEFELSNVGASVTQVRVLVSGALGATVPVTGSGKYSAIVLGGAVPSIGIQSQNSTGVGYAFSLDNVSVKELFGNHAYQTVSASRPVLQRTPILGDELIVNGNFETSIELWAMTLVTAVVEDAKCKLTVNSTGGRLAQSIPTVAGKTYQISWEAQSIVSTPMIRVGTASGLGDVLSVNDATGNRSAFFTAVGASTVIGLTIQVAGGQAYFDNISVKEVTGYRTDQNYLAFDGTDDFLQTNNIDFASTDKVSVFAGVRKLSSATRGILLHTGAKLPAPGVLGNFDLEAPSFEMKGYSAAVPAAAGNIDAKDSNTLTPHSAVISVKYWQGSPSISSAIALKVNNILMPTLGGGSTLQGNFANLPMYIGRRGGTALPFNGHIYSLIGIGRLTTDAETIALEKLIAKNTGVTLSV